MKNTVWAAGIVGEVGGVFPAKANTLFFSKNQYAAQAKHTE
jgi:hypothetical protein